MNGLIFLFILYVILTFLYFTKPKKVKPLAIYTYSNGQKLLHNDNGPAYIDSIGTEEWYQYGNLHREDGPARLEDDTQYWFKNDLKHRIDGPAVIRINNDYSGFDFEWYQNGLLHRIDGPAIELADGHREWWIEGKKHRLDGPAIEELNELDLDSYKQWWYKGNQIQCNSQSEFNRLIKLKIFW